MGEQHQCRGLGLLAEPVNNGDINSPPPSSQARRWKELMAPVAWLTWGPAATLVENILYND